MDVNARDVPFLVGYVDTNVDELSDDVHVRHRMPRERQRRERSAFAERQHRQQLIGEVVSHRHAGCEVASCSYT
jgi:hypothetical protein